MTGIIVGSAAFFSDIDDYKALITDEVAIVEKVKNGWWQHIQTKDHIRLFHWQQHTLLELVEKLSHFIDCNRVTTLLVPDFAKALKGSMSDNEYLITIKPAIDHLCNEHQWGRIVYEAYKKNGKLELLPDQRKVAYEAYKAARLGLNELYDIE